ncbi:MAG: calcium-translocating P-type ATPase, PMCA-type [Spirochaetaceae bacterium]|nr:calcium-translocating P-type ATPase, PMCA-type [Spirochaetaceae bacterium]
MQGLTPEQVKANQAKYGLNVLTPPKRKTMFRLYIEKFNDPTIKILLLAAIVASITGLFKGEIAEGVAIFIAILLSTGLAFINEYKAGKEFDLLNKVSDDQLYKVIRGGSYQLIERKYITIDDLVALETGDEVPADALIIEAGSFEVDESPLTGESLPVHKIMYDGNSHQANADDPYPVYKAFKGTFVRNGHAIVKIMAIGDNAEMGKTARLAGEDNELTSPLKQQLEGLAKVIARVGFTIALFLLVVLSGRAFMQGLVGFDLPLLVNIENMLIIFMIAVTIIVVSVPEGLPMSVTLSLAYSMRKMMKDNTLVRKMEACETIGATTVICSDKTGTLTMNQMRLAELYYNHNDGQQNELISLALAANSSANLSAEGKVVGNPTEGALLLYLKEQGQNYQILRDNFKVINQLPFHTQHKYMATFGRYNAKKMVLVKGAPEAILERCANFNGKTKTEWQNIMHSEQAKARRTLGFAYSYLEDNDEPDLLTINNLTWLGLAGIADPVRPEVPQAVADCLTAGIGIKMLTGDSIETAREIGREAGLLKEDSLILTGAEFEALSAEEAEEKVSSLVIMARARPQDKLRLVKLLQKKGEVVAVTGDGSNDGPALNHADVGLAMGQTGTAIAKEASDIILLNDSFKSIINGVMWGRGLYLNIQRFIMFQLTSNIAAITIALAGPFIGVDLPFTVMQFLWINLIMDTLGALALASEEATPQLLKEPPRNSKAFIITKAMAIKMFSTAGLFVAIMLGYLIANGRLSAYQSTIFFHFFVMLQLWNLFNMRLFKQKFRLKQFFANNLFWLVVAAILAGQILIGQFGGNFFRTVPINVSTWLSIIALSAGVFIIMRLATVIAAIKK